MTSGRGEEYQATGNITRDYYLALTSSPGEEPAIKLICDRYRLFAPERRTAGERR